MPRNDLVMIEVSSLAQWFMVLLVLSGLSKIGGERTATAQDARPADLHATSVLLHKDDMNYVGAFRVPSGKIGASEFSYGGTALAFCAAHQSLFMVGHDHQQAIAEISIPALKTGSIEDLNVAEVLQPFTTIIDRVSLRTLEGIGRLKVGGLLITGEKIVGTVYGYYDGKGSAMESHFVMSSLKLDTAEVAGLFRVGSRGGGVTAGYMTPIPLEWRNRLGARYLTGQAGLSIISRTSSGPAAFGFDPELLGERPGSAISYVYYPLNTPLAPGTTQNPLFNLTTQIRGVMFAENTRSVLFFGSHGIGPYCYGGDECNDPIRKSKGTHAAPYVYQVWAYDANDFVSVADKKKAPWKLLPYDVWQFDFPYPESNKYIGGVAFDPEKRLLYVSQQGADSLKQFDSKPIIHVFRIP